MQLNFVCRLKPSPCWLQQFSFLSTIRNSSGCGVSKLRQTKLTPRDVFLQAQLLQPEFFQVIRDLVQGEGQGCRVSVGKRRQAEPWDRSARCHLLGCVTKLQPPLFMELFSANNFLCLLIIDINFRILALMSLLLGLVMERGTGT